MADNVGPVHAVYTLWALAGLNLEKNTKIRVFRQFWRVLTATRSVVQIIDEKCQKCVENDTFRHISAISVKTPAKTPFDPRQIPFFWHKTTKNGDFSGFETDYFIPTVGSRTGFGGPKKGQKWHFDTGQEGF